MDREGSISGEVTARNMGLDGETEDMENDGTEVIYYSSSSNEDENDFEDNEEERVGDENDLEGNEEDGVGDEDGFEDNEEEGVREGGFNVEGESKLLPEKAINDVEDLLRINFEEITIEEVRKYHFCDTSMGFMFYNWYASKHGFAARKCRIVRNRNGDVTQQTFVCHREGVRRERNSLTIKRQSRPNTRCGCEARVKVHVEATSGRWYIKEFYDVHNHSFLDDNFKGMLPAHRRMTDYDKYQMGVMREAGIKTTNIYGYFANQVGGFEKVGYSKRDMYNEQVKKRRSRFSDAKAAMDFLNGMCSQDNSMFWRHTVDEDGHLQNLFWCDGISRMDYSVFGDVLAFDATYRKVRYLCPFVVFSGVNHHNQSIVFAAAVVGNESDESYVWLLEKFLEAMGGKSPVSVITDGCPSMRKAIRIVFPRAHHRLCAWHLIRNATTNIKNAQFVSRFKHCMMADIDDEEFNRKWEEMVEEFGLEENLWVLEMYEKRRMWSASQIRGNFFAGFRTTSRCESLNAEFGRYVNVRSNLVDFLKYFFRWVEYMRYREFEADFASTPYSEPVLQTEYRSLEKCSSSLFTKEIHKIFCQVLKRVCNCYVACSRNRGTKFGYTVSRYDKHGQHWSVSYCELSYEFKCSCLRFESLGIPCEHIICVLLFLGIKQLPEGLVLKRWTKGAKDGLILPSSKKRVFASGDLMSTYVGIVERCKKMATAAVELGKPEYVRKTMEFVDNYTYYLQAVGRGEDVEVPCGDPYADGTIKNPLQTRSKGCGGPSSSQKKSEKTPKKRPTCRNCGKTGHNRKSCHVHRRVEIRDESDDFMEDADMNVDYSEFDQIIM